MTSERIERPVTATAIAAVRALLLEYAAAVGVDLATQNFAQELAGLPGLYQPPAGCLLLATIDGEAVGCVGFRPLPNGRCEMKRLYVRPPYRQTGVGRRLVRRLIDNARSAGYVAMRLDTLRTMQAAGALYRSFGFVPIPAYWNNVLPDVEYLELAL